MFGVVCRHGLSPQGPHAHNKPLQCSSSWSRSPFCATVQVETFLVHMRSVKIGCMRQGHAHLRLYLSIYPVGMEEIVMEGALESEHSPFLLLVRVETMVAAGKDSLHC